MLIPTTPTEKGLAALFSFSIAITLGASIGLYYVLLKIETQIAADLLNSYADDADNLELSVENKEKEYTSMDSPTKKKQLELEVNQMSCSATDFDPQQNSYASIHSSKKSDTKNEERCMSSLSSTTLRISLFRKIILASLTVVLILLNYLLMVLSQARELLSFLGLALVSMLVLQRHILEEVRSTRYDRLASMVSFLLIASMSMNLACYAVKEVATEQMYQGPARIVGYDTSKYETLQAGQETTNTKSDLEVAWGDRWACPSSPNKECRAVVDGALCEMDDNSTLWDDDYGGTDTTKMTQEVYYDKNGKKVDKENDHDTYYDKDGNVIEDYKAHETTQFNENSKVENYEEDSSDTEYDSNEHIKVVESTQKSVNYTDTGKVKQGTYEYKDSEYDDGKLVEDHVEDKENSQTASGGQEDIDHTLDVSYNEEGSIEGEQYTGTDTTKDATGETDVDETLDANFNADGSLGEEFYIKSETEKDTTGEKTHQNEEEMSIENDNQGNLENEFVEQDEATYKDGKVDEETMEVVAVAENSDGSHEYEKEDETVKNGEYNVTLEDVLYDKNGNVIEDEKESYDGGGNRIRRRLEEDSASNKQQLEDELQQEHQDNEQLKKENAELHKEIEELQNELTKESNDNKPEHEDDDWGETDWGSVWGDYQCYNLFDADLEGVKFNARKPPGSDDWPYLNIYGNCQTCEAYIVDYYSTEHFQSIQSYKQASRKFGIAACFSLLVTVALALKHRFSSKQDNEINLLESKIGTFA